MNNVKRLIGMLAVTAVLGAGCVPFNTGISGHVDVGPACPENTNCPNAGPAMVLISNDKGDPLTTVKTDASGNFRAPVGPGKYIVQATRGKGLAPADIGTPKVVDVAAGHYTIVQLKFDK